MSPSGGASASKVDRPRAPLERPPLQYSAQTCGGPGHTMRSETPGSPPAIGRHQIEFSVDVETLGHQFKRARVGNPNIGSHTIFCDEPASYGGDGSAPSPLQYFAASLGF